MKKLILVFAFFAFTTTVFGQDENPERINYGNRIGPGTVLLSGGVSYEKSFSDDKNFNATFGGQFALSKRFAFDLGFGYQTKKAGHSTTMNEKVFFVIPGFTIFGNIKYGWLQPHVDVTVPVGFATYDLNTTYGEFREVRATSVSGVISPGLNIYLSKKIALSTSLGLIRYTSTKEENAEEADTSFGISFSPLDLSLGLVFVLGAK